MAYIPIIIFSLVVGLAMLLLQQQDKLGAYPDFAWLSYAFCTLMTFLVMMITQVSRKMSNAGKSVGVALGAMGLRFIFSLLFILGYVLFAKPANARFIIPFFILYFLYTALETYYMAKNKAQ